MKLIKYSLTLSAMRIKACVLDRMIFPSRFLVNFSVNVWKERNITAYNGQLSATLWSLHANGSPHKHHSEPQRRIQDLKIGGAQPKILKNRGGAAENFRKLTCTFNGWYPKNRGGARLLRPPPPLDPPLNQRRRNRGGGAQCPPHFFKHPKSAPFQY